MIPEKHIYKQPAPSSFKEICQRPSIDATYLNEVIDGVFNSIREKGDDALKDFTARFDGVLLEDLDVHSADLAAANDLVPTDLKKAIDQAYENIYQFHKAQILESKKIETTKGVVCWQESRGIDKVGLYIPGGSAPLFSTVLMLGIPAQIAGCKEVVLCSPPNREGNIHPAILYAAQKCGIRKILKLGGAQAIGAMVLGTDSVPNVYKIFGPGNQYVTAAKMKAQSLGVAIDMPAGPSEVLVFADETAHPEFIAADLLSQAEHGPDSQVVLVTTDESLITSVQEALKVQLDKLSRRDIAIKSLEHALLCIFDTRKEAYDFINEYAPEHFIIASDRADEDLTLIRNAGSVFIGNYTPESAGDYASGTNHTLPTAAFARAYSGVSLDSFIKKITFQKISKEGINLLGNTIITMAENEALTAHANAVKIRMKP